jgi:hypothetical protein
MRRIKVWLLIVSALALVSAGAAVAHGKRDKTHTDAAAATLAATQARIANKTCTGQDGAYRAFHGKWTGTATGDPRLTGTLRLYARGLVNTTTGSGQVTGWLAIRSDKSAAKARFVAVYTNGTLNGYVIGWVRDKTGGTVEETSGSGRLLGSLNGTLAPDGALAAKIGAGGVAAAIANIQAGGCKNGDDHKKHR